MFGFPADYLGDGPLGILLHPFKLMDDFPIFKPSFQFPGFKQEVGIVGSPKPGLSNRKSLIEKETALFQSLSDTGDKGPMKIPEDQNSSIGVFR